MATRQPCSSSFKEQFDDQLTCGVCLDQYTNPKTLPCLHSFCLSCIKQIPLERKDELCYFRCPMGCADHLLPPGGVSTLPSAFHINSLLDLRKTLDTDDDQTMLNKRLTTEMPQQSICPKHNDLLNVYCETCDKVICRDCTISTEHNKHEYQLISECYSKHCRIILENLIKFKRKTAEIDKAIILLDSREKEILEQGENVKEQINTHAQQLIDNIQESKIRLTHQVDFTVQLKRQTLATQKQKAQKLYTQLKICQDTIEKRFKTATLKRQIDLQMLKQKTTMIDEMNTATQHVDPAVFQPIEDAEIRYNKVEKNSLGSIATVTYDKATLEVSPCTARQPSTATLTLHSQDGSPFSLPPSLISCTLSSPGNAHSMNCPVSQIRGKSLYKIAYTPSTKNDTLIVQVGGVDVPDSPFTLPVPTSTPETSGAPVSIISGLDHPWDIAVGKNGDIVITEKGTRRVKLISLQHNKTRSFYIGNKGNQPGIAISNDGHILVTDYHQLQKLTTDGVCVKSVGSSESGSGQLQFYFPAGITVHPITGQIYVADSGNNRIQVFNNDLTFSHAISNLGLFHSFKTPCDIAIDRNDEYLYVTEYNNHCITKLSNKGKYTKRFSSHGFAPGQLKHPFFLAIHNDIIYVTDSGNNRVSIFDTNGRFIAESKIKPGKPRGIATDSLGNLYVVDSRDGDIIHLPIS